MGRRLESMSLRRRLAFRPGARAALQLLALLWGVLSCHPGHALECRHDQPDAHAHAVSTSVPAETPHPRTALSAFVNGCDGDALVAPFRRDGQDAPVASARAAWAGDLGSDLPARTVGHTVPSSHAAHSLALARPLRI